MRYHVFRGNAREPHGGFGDYRGTRPDLAAARELLLTGADSLEEGHIVSDDGTAFSVLLVLTWRGRHAILEAPGDRDLTAMAIAEAAEGNALYAAATDTGDAPDPDDLADLVADLALRLRRQEITKPSEFAVIVQQAGFTLADPAVQAHLRAHGFAEWLA